MGTYIQPYFEDHGLSEELQGEHIEVVRLLNSQFGKQKTTKYYRINCHLVNDNTDDIVSITGRIIEVNVSYTITIQKDRDILSFYYNLVSRLNDQFEIGLDLAKAREEGLKKLKVKEHLYSPKKIRSKDKQHSYVLYYSFESVGVLALGVLVYDQNDEVVQKIKFATNVCGVLVEETIKSWIGKTSWLSDDTIIIYSSNKVDYWHVNLNAEVRFYFQRAERGDAHGQYDLAMMYKHGKGVCADKVLYQYWLDKAVTQGYRRAIKEKR